ncbi:multidrug effflux MFS transporter [Pengzhenrongella sicca]|uniref:Multidrug effflux MFS transporter n=1 Tax=Pengzhenrongella sicca TaxID=2819238 RepID=A0A8A4ZIU2_9MICO|nr:multidrug effflux MFS transporter [Pengzhenrongella sicca]
MRRILLVTLALLTALTPLATDMYLPAMPAMAGELGVSASVVQLTLTTFLIGLAAGQLVIGPLSDQWGRRRLLVVGTVVCAAAGAACALAPDAAWLVGARFVQGFAGAAGIVLARAVISDVARGIRAAQLFSAMMVIQGVAPVVAPLLGGALVPAVGWRGVYWVLTGFAVVLVLAVVRAVPETHPVHLRSAGGLGALGRDARLVLTNRSFVGYTLSFVFCFGTMFAYIAASPFVLQNILGLSPGRYSVAFAVNAVGIIVASVVSARIVARTGPRRLVVVGAAVMLGASLLLVVGATAWGLPLWPTLALLFLAVGSLGLVAGNATTLALGQVPGASGTGSAVLGALQFTLAAAVSPLVGIAGERSAVPMVLAMAACATLSAAAVALTPARTDRTTGARAQELEAAVGHER